MCPPKYKANFEIRVKHLAFNYIIRFDQNHPQKKRKNININLITSNLNSSVLFAGFFQHNDLTIFIQQNALNSTFAFTQQSC